MFSDGQDICVWSEGKVQTFKSKFIERAKNSLEQGDKSSEWKYSGEGARFRGDVKAKQGFESRINGVYMAGNGAAYSFTVNETSGIYIRPFYDEKTPETHVITSVEYSFGGGCLNSGAQRLAVSMARGPLNADIALFDLKTGSYITVTDGDTQDTDPFFAPDDANLIYFSSRGAGRDANGEFVEFSPAAICALDLRQMEIKEVAASPKYSYYKPVLYAGRLYAVKAPARDKKPNPVVSFLLIPWRILQAVANLFTIFIHAFTGKSVTSGGSNPAKGREYDSRKEFVKGNLIDVEKAGKKGKKQGEDGFMPPSWQLVEINSGEVLATGVADYDISSRGEIVYTNGRHIFSVVDGKRKKLCSAGLCLNVAFEHSSKKDDDLFGF